MENKRLQSIPLPETLELVGDGPSFQSTLCTMLEQAKGFENFSQADLVFLAKHMKAYRVPEGATIFREGERNSYFCILSEGRVCVYKEDAHNDIKLLTVIPPGRIFGEISLIDDFPYSASIVAETEAVFLLMSRENFRHCVEERPVLGVRLLGIIARMLCARLRSTSGQLIDTLDP
ncbi:MAG: cyclic nucleotide-binding domain-containing protein [Gallionella sp.]|nr:cyclic nucleotide-binding domain-containing protein [Gallionella sp.]